MARTRHELSQGISKVNNTLPRPALTPETTTFLNIFVGALSAWTFIRLATKIRKGATDHIDKYILRALPPGELSLGVPRFRRRDC